MVKENLKKFVEAVEESNYKEARSIVRDIIGDRGDVEMDLEDISGINSKLAKKIRNKGYDSLGKLANAPLDGLIKISELAEGPAKEVFETARKQVLKDLTELPGVGEGTAKDMVNNGYTSLGDVSRSSVEKLSEVPGIGKKGAEKIIKTAEEKAVTRLEDLPGVGGGTAENMREAGFTPLHGIAESSIEELVKIPNIGRNGAEKILDYAKDNPEGDIEDLPGVGKETAEEIRKYGYTAIKYVADSTVEELSQIPGIGKKGAEDILEFAREKSGGTIDDLTSIDDGIIETLKKQGFNTITDLATSSLEKLIKIPKLREGKAKKVKESAQELLRESGGDTQGYERALKGVISSMKEERPLSLPFKILEGKYPEDRLKEIKGEMKERASHVFRPPEEKSYYEAWTDLLDAFLDMD